MLLLLLCLSLAAAQPAEEVASLQELLEGLTSPVLVRGAVLQAARDAGLQGDAARCVLDMQRWEQDAEAGARWALQMTDSWSKSITGTLYGNTADLGNYDECLDSTASVETLAISARYAMPKIGISSLNLEANNSWALLSLPVSLRVSLCVPESCAVELLQAGLQSLSDRLASDWPARGVTVAISFPAPFQSVQPRHLHMGPEHWIVICLIAVLAVIPLVATAVEHHLESSEQDKGNATRWRLLLCFSLRSSYRRLTAPDPRNAITSLNGIRVLSAIWVIVGHVYSVNSSMPVMNKKELNEMTEGIGFMFLLNFSLAVDSFFAVTGMLCTMSLFRELSKCSRFNWLSYALQRFLRTTPVVAVYCFCSATLFEMLMVGPTLLSVECNFSCSPHWWIQILNLSDYIIPETSCLYMVHLWYLSADFKLYVLAPVVLLPLYWRPRLGFVWLAVVSLASLLSPAIISVIYGLRNQYDMIAKPDQADLILRTIYKPMHAHAGPFMVGIIFGVFLFKWRSGALSFKPSKTVNAMIFGLALALLSAVVLGSFNPYDAKHHPSNAVETFFYNGFYRPAWSVGVLLLVLASESNRTGILNGFLSWGGFTILSRLSFAIYVVHPIINVVEYQNKRTPIYMSLMYQARDDVFVFFCATICAAVLFLFVEVPFMLLVSEMKRRLTKHPALPQKNSEETQKA